MTAAAPMPDPDSVRIWRDDFWWRLVDGQWTAVETRSSGGAQWTAPPAGGVPADLEAVGQGALALSAEHPIAVATADGTVYLFTSEWGAVGARWLVGGSGTSALLTLPIPPLIVVLRPHPIGRRSVELSTEYVRFAILRDKSNRWLAPWVRRTIQAAGLPDPRGRPNPDNVVAALFAQQKKEMAFVNDPLHGEMMANVSDLLCLDPAGLCMRGGDCDDQIIVLGSAVASAGIPVRLLVRRYANSAQSHVTLQYQLRDGSWKCIDPSTDSGACSAAPYIEQFTVDVVDSQNPRLEFLGLGSHDAGALAGLGELAPEEGEAAVAIAMRVHDLLSRSAGRLRQNAGAALGLGAPPDADASRLIATADLLTDAIEDGCRGGRPLSVTPSGDLLIGARMADTFAMVMATRQRTSGQAVFEAAFAEPESADHSLGACYIVAQQCDHMATALLVHALGDPPADVPSGVLPSDVLAYRAAWDPYVMGIARGLTSCAAAWRLLADGKTLTSGDPSQPNVGQFAVTPDATELGLWADTLAQEAQSLVDSWNLHAGSTDAEIVLQAGAFLQDYQATVQRAGSFYAPELKKNCPSIPIPGPPSLDDQTQIIARIEGLKILSHGVLQLMTIGASGALQTYGAIAEKAADLIPGPVGLGIGGAVVGVALTLGGLYLLSRLGIFAGGGHRAVASAPGRRRAAVRRPSYRRVGRLSAGRLYAERIRIDRRGYDPSGRYWGRGAPLYRVSDPDGEIDVYVRALSAASARRRVQEGEGTKV